MCISNFIKPDKHTNKLAAVQLSVYQCLGTKVVCCFCTWGSD